MEQQFILRLPDKLKTVDPKDCRLNKINNKEVSFYHKEKEYKGIICKIPTIIESQKEIDNKIYKIADISTMVVIYDTEFNLEEEIKKHESSGLTPPTKFIKERRFSKVFSIKSEEIEEIEKQVSNLLKEDSQALKVEIISNENEMDLDIIAAEIESNLVKKEEIKEDKKVVKKGLDRDNIMMDIKDNIMDIKIVNKDNNIVIRENVGRKDTKDKMDKINKVDKIDKVNKIDGFGNVDKIKENISIEENVNEILNIQNLEVKKEDIVEDSELLSIMQKIKEKEELLIKAANPILKKRFEQALNELKIAYEKKKSEIGK